MIKKSNCFPVIYTCRYRNMIEGTAGIDMKSVLNADLLVDKRAGIKDNNYSKYNRLHPKTQHDSRVALLHAISSWPADVILELHMTSYPNLQNRQQSYLWITLFIKTIADKVEKVKEEILKRYLSLMPVLSAHLSEYEFEPIILKKELLKRLRPFVPKNAISVTRKKKSISLSTPINRLSIGFGQMASHDEAGNNNVVHCFPFIPSTDNGERLINTIIGQLDPVKIVIRIKNADDDKEVLNNLSENIRKCELFLSSNKEYMVTLNRQATIIRDISLVQLAAVSDTSFDLAALIFAPAPIDSSLGKILGKSITGIISDEGENFLFKGGFSLKDIEIDQALNRMFFSEKQVSLNETASVLRLPAPPFNNLPGLPVKRSRTSHAIIPSLPSLKDGSVELFNNVHRGINQAIRVKADDRMRHTFILGQTGTGKSSLMESMVMQDVINGKGVAVIDPHGDMIDSIIGRIPAKRAGDVILFDLLDRERPIGFNILEYKTIEERDLIIDELYLTIDRLYDMKSVGGPIFESNFRGMLKLLMQKRRESNFSPTLLEFLPCYIDSNFRNWLIKSINDSQVCDFINELEQTKGEASINNLSPYITSKFNRFINDTTLRRIIGQEKTGFDFDDIINNGKIFLVKLGRGRWGSVTSGLIANMLVSRFKLAVMKRGDIKPEERKAFYLYADESQTLPSENFNELLNEARKYRMGLILATQYTKQLADSSFKNNSLLSSILGNVGTFIVFRLGQEDAAMLEATFYPEFSSLDIISLPNYNGYAKMQLENMPTPPFSFITRKNETPYSERNAKKIRSLSRSKYGKDANSIDSEILRRRNVWKK